MSVTVAEIAGLPVMRGAVIVAGERALDNQIRWVHVSEQLDIARFLKGGELLLTTGMGLSVSPEQQARYMHALAACGVAAVAISLVPWVRRVPPALITAAEEVGLPLLAFTGEVPFVQITEEVHTLIVNRHYAQFRQAEAVAHQLNRAALQNQSAAAILRILHQVLKNPVACLSHDDGAVWETDDPLAPDEGELRSFYPPGNWGADLISQLLQLDLLSHPTEAAEPTGTHEEATPLTVPLRVGRRDVDVWLQPIVISGERWGYLAVVQSGRRLDEVERLVVDRAAVTLAYEILRRRSLREQRRGTTARMAERLLSGDVPDPELFYRKARSLGHALENRWLAAGVVEVPEGRGRETVERLVARACSELALGCLLTWRKGKLHLALYGDDEHGLKTRLNKLGTGLEAGDQPGLLTGFGRPLQGLEGLPRGVQQAEFTLALRRRPGTPDVGPLFDSTGIYRLLVVGADPVELHRFVGEELGLLLQAAGGESQTLLATLRVLLDSSLAVAVAARTMGVSRQTIYQRRSRIEEILRCSLDDPEKRIALSLALRAQESKPLTAPVTRA